MTTKQIINQDKDDPLWQEIVKRFPLEIKSPPSAVPDTNSFYYKDTRGRLKVTDFNWYLIDGSLLIREKKS